MSARKYATDVLTRHQVYLQRYANSQVKAMQPIMKTMLRDVKRRIVDANLNSLQLRRLKILERDLKLIIKSSMEGFSAKLLNDLKDLGASEAGFTTKLLNDLVDVNLSGTNIAKVNAAITKSKMSLITGKAVKSLTIEKAVKQFSKSASKGILRKIQSGLIEGSTTQTITDSIDGLVKSRSAAQAEALVRTATNHAASTARNAVYKDNEDIIDKEEYLSTLDNRTSLTCAGLDGKYFPVGEGDMPPMHFNCRSVRIPVVKPEYTVKGLEGKRASKGDNGGEQVGGGTTFGGWLHTQPVKFQDTVLGTERGILFRKGSLPITNFTNDKGITLTLKQLRRAEPEAYAKAISD